MKDSWKKLSSFKKILLIFLVIFLVIFSYKTILRLQKKPLLSKRALVVLAESSEYLVPNDVKFYEDNKSAFIPLISLAFNVNKTDLEGKSAVEIVDLYGEPFWAQLVLRQARDYGETVVLTDETATLDDLTNSIVDLSRRGYKVDVILNVHGGGTVYLFGEDYVSTADIYKKLADKKLNLGFVYQTACYGSQQLELWETLGAEAVSGSLGVNFFPIIAPAVFLDSWTSGKGYEESVEKGYQSEISLYKNVGRIWPDVGKWATQETITSSKMLYLGNSSLNIRD